VSLNQFGRIARESWQAISNHFPLVAVDVFIVMPSHIHGIFFISENTGFLSNGSVRAQHAAPVRANAGSLPKVVPGSLGAIVRSYKSSVTRAVNRLRNSLGAPVWHRNYYERVIRDERELDSIRHYITNNPLKISQINWSPDSQTIQSSR
jgi:REP element-mobilizing transposase RayT